MFLCIFYKNGRCIREENSNARITRWKVGHPLSTIPNPHKGRSPPILPSGEVFTFGLCVVKQRPLVDLHEALLRDLRGELGELPVLLFPRQE